MSALGKFLAPKWRERLLLLEAVLYLGAARAALLTIPFKYISRSLGQQLPADTVAPRGAPVSTAARQIGWAVKTMGRRTPWDSACLAQSIAGKLMLRKRGLASLLFLGMKKDEAGKLTAHAWLQAGNEILIGAAGHETFTVLSTFGDPCR